VFTAFSGSHQDAIRKGMAALERGQSDRWEVPYLPIDPRDLGRSYEAVIRINSQSGKGGVAWILEQDHGLRMPRGLQVEFAGRVQELTDESGAELTSLAVWQAFRDEYLDGVGPVAVLSHRPVGEGAADFRVRLAGREKWLRGEGNGPIAALVDALERGLGRRIRVLDCAEHALGEGAEAQAAAYVEVDLEGTRGWGVGIHESIATAAIRAVACAVGRLLSPPS